MGRNLLRKILYIFGFHLTITNTVEKTSTFRKRGKDFWEKHPPESWNPPLKKSDFKNFKDSE